MKRTFSIVKAVVFLALSLAACGPSLSNSPTLVSIGLTPANPSISNGTSVQFAATGVFSDNTTTNLTAQVGWSSSNTAVATVDTSGKAAATSAGTTTITATLASVSGTAVLTVKSAALVSIAVTPGDPFIAEGTSKQFTATGTFADNSTQDLTTQATWNSSTTTVAAIDAVGKATSLTAGNTTITATLNGVSGTTALTVTNAALTSIAVTPADPSIAKGTTKQFTATGTFTDTTTQDLTSQATWTTSDPTKATITADGLATGTGVGSATVSALFSGITESTSLTVTPAVLISIAVTPPNPSITIGRSQQFTAVGTYTDNSTQTITDVVTWGSSSTGVATISNANGFHGLATSVNIGSTTISATDPATNVSDLTMLTVSTSPHLIGGAIQGRTLNLAGNVTTYVGMPPGSTDGISAAARFSQPSGITTDGTNLYVADQWNSTIRKIVIATGQVTTFAGTAGSLGSSDGTGTAARFFFPTDVTTDGTNLFVADEGNNTIRKIVLATGQVTTLAGTPGSFGAADGTGSTALFYMPSGITTDGMNLYVADGGNSTIRKIVIATGQVTTLAGMPGSFGSADGTGSAALFNGPTGITTDGINLYVADEGNCTIREIVIATGQVTTLAGTAGLWGYADGSGATASFYWPFVITTDGTNLYVGENDNVRKIVIATGQVTTLAGMPGSAGYADGTGYAARFIGAAGITTDGINVYVSDNDTIRKIVIATEQVSTFAGVASTGSVDGIGSGARLNWPAGITTDGTNLYVSDTWNSTIRQIVIATGQVTTLAGMAGLSGSTDGIGAAARFGFPTGITTDGSNLYVADACYNTIRKIVIATGEVTTLAGTAGLSGSTDGIGAAARFWNVYGITMDGANLYVADRMNSTVRKIVIETAQVTTLAGTAGSSGSADGTGAAARFNQPYGITTDGTNLYVADSNNNTIRMIVIATGQVTTLAGMAGLAGSTDGIGSAALFFMPWGITTDGANLYVADNGNNTIRKIVIATGQSTTPVGTPGAYSGYTDGIGGAASFRMPIGITTDGIDLYLPDTWNNTIRRIQ